MDKVAATMNKRRFAQITIWLTAYSALSVGLLPERCNQSLLMPTAAAATSERGSRTLLDAHSLKLANRGNWSELVERLQSLTDADTQPNANHAWLAFGLMFLDKCDDLKSLSQKVSRLATSDTTSNIPQVVEVFNLICQKKYAEAEKLATNLAGSKADVVVNMALAAVSAKNGDAAKAIEYCNKAVSEAPDFAWGYRTIGFIEERTLKNNAAAEQAYQLALAIEPDFKEARDLLVDRHIARNDFDGALDVANAAIKADPHDPANYYRLSQIYTQQWRLREADEQLDKAIRLSPDNARFHRAKASILRYQQKLKEAIAEQQRAVDLSADKPFELTELAALNELAGNDSAAADNLKQAIALSPASQSAHQAAHQKLVLLLTRVGRFDDLAAEYRKAIELQPDQSVLHLGLADALIRTGKSDQAMEELKKAAELDSNDPRPHRMMGAIYLDRHEFPAAARAYTRALNINPGSVEDLSALGYTYAANGDYMQAETAFVTALALQQLTQSQGNREMVMRSLATLLLAEGRYTEAAVNYDEILRVLKNSPAAQQDSFMLAESKALRDRSAAASENMIKGFDSLPDAAKDLQRAGLIDALLRLGKVDQALEQLGKVPAAARQECQWLILEARAERQKGDLKAAQASAVKAVAAKEDNKDLQAAAHTELAEVLLAQGDLNGADNEIRKATDCNMKSFSAYEVMGRIYKKRGDLEHTIEAAKHAIDINPYYAPAYMLIGDANLQAGKLDAALTNYKRAVELYPSSLEAHKSLRDLYKKLADKEQTEKEDQLIQQMEKSS